MLGRRDVLYTGFFYLALGAQRLHHNAGMLGLHVHFTLISTALAFSVPLSHQHAAARQMSNSLPLVQSEVPLAQALVASRRKATAPVMMARVQKASSKSKSNQPKGKKALVIRSKDKSGKEFDGFISEQNSASYYITWGIALGIYALMFYGIASKVQG